MENSLISQDDIDAMGYDYYTPDPKQSVGVMDMVQEFSGKTEQKPDAALYARLIAEEADEWRSEYLRDTGAEQLKELADMVYVIYGFANAKGWDLDEAVRRVHSNNLGRCIREDGSIQRREDGKIIKNPSYPKVNLWGLV